MTQVERHIPFGNRRLAITIDWDRGRGLIGVVWQPGQLSGPEPALLLGVGYLTIGINVYDALDPEATGRLARWQDDCQGDKP